MPRGGVNKWLFCSCVWTKYCAMFLLLQSFEGVGGECGRCLGDVCCPIWVIGNSCLVIGCQGMLVLFGCLVVDKTSISVHFVPEAADIRG